MAKDTIITRPILFGNAYLLDGKRLNIQVMQWIMTDHPFAHDQIRVSVVSGQMAAVGYTVGGMIFLGGLLVWQDDKAAGKDLMLMGGAGIGAKPSSPPGGNLPYPEPIEYLRRPDPSTANASGSGILSIGSNTSAASLQAASRTPRVFSLSSACFGKAMDQI